MRNFSKWLLLCALALTGIWALAASIDPGPRPGARQAARPQAPAAAQPGLQFAPQPGESFTYQPVEPTVVNVSELPPFPSDFAGLYDRWLAGEVDLDEQEGRFPAEVVALMQMEALALPPAKGVQSAAPVPLAPTPGISFSSLDYTETGGSVPPDPHLAAGPSHLIAVANVAFEIYNKQGTSLVGPAAFSSFFAGVSGCTGLFDPVTLYDEAANRYILGIDGDGDTFCIGVSQSGDPTGNWHLYSFATNISGAFFDYPHIGVGRDAVYLGANQFLGNSFFEGRVWVMNKGNMYAGQPMTPVTFSVGGNSGTPQPLHLHGFQQGTWPTSGPHHFVTDPGNGDSLQLWSWSNALSGSAPSLVATLNLESFTGVNGGFPLNFPQQGGNLIQANDWRFRGFEYHSGSGWVADTISCNPGAGSTDCVRWAEINLTTNAIVQAGVLGTSGIYRTFPDLAVNECGDMAVGYTRSSSATYPAVYVTGRLAGDPAGTLQGEALLKAGEKSYTGFDAPPYRWGDYTGMTIDPDGETFWYLGQYSKNITAAANWGTYIGSFSYPSCGAPPPSFDEQNYVPMALKNASSGGPPPPPVGAVCRQPGLAIPDGNAAGVSDTMQVSAAATLTDLDVYLDISHTWVGDLLVSLRNVDTGEIVTLIDRPGIPGSTFGCEEDDVDATLDDEAGAAVEGACAATGPAISGRFRPNEALSAFNGESYAGSWRLTVADLVGGDSGQLNEWCLVPNATP